MAKPTDKDVLDYMASLRRVPAATVAAAKSMLSREDEALALRQKQALAFLDKAIQPINREIIRKAMPGLNRDKYVEFAAVVAELRADYLAAAMAYFVEQRRRQGEADSGAVRALRDKREAYEEALHAYEALHRALERGYVDPVE